MTLCVPWLLSGLLSSRTGRARVLANLFLDVFGKGKVCIVVRVSLSEVARVLGIFGNPVPKDFSIMGTIASVPLVFS